MRGYRKRVRLEGLGKGDKGWGVREEMRCEKGWGVREERWGVREQPWGVREEQWVRRGEGKGVRQVGCERMGDGIGMRWASFRSGSVVLENISDPDPQQLIAIRRVELYKNVHFFHYVDILMSLFKKQTWKMYRPKNVLQKSSILSVEHLECAQTKAVALTGFQNSVLFLQACSCI